MDVLVVRHAQSTWNAEHRWAGQADPPLSPEGQQTARTLAHRLRDARLEAVASSDLRRAHEAAAIVANSLRLPAPVAISEFRERHAGAWTGRTSREIETAHPGLLQRWRDGYIVDPPASEPWDAFEQRVLGALLGLPETLPFDRVLIVAHQGTVRALGHHFRIERSEIASTDGIWLTLSQGELERDTLFSLNAKTQSRSP
jgi:broad specificity phosphatase PhoE